MSNTKTCTKCNRTKTLDCFSKRTSSRDGLQPSCKACVKEYNKQQYDKNPEYWVWRNIIARCTNPNNPKYKDYGARGITVCQRWLDSYENFLIDMGRLPAKNLQINRINNNLGYTRDNCKWSTVAENNRNRRAFGSTKTRGVYKAKDKYAAKLWLNDKLIHIGTFNTKEEASAAYNKARNQHFPTNNQYTIDLETMIDLVDYLEEQLDIAQKDNAKLTRKYNKLSHEADSLKITIAELLAEELINTKVLN